MLRCVQNPAVFKITVDGGSDDGRPRGRWAPARPPRPLTWEDFCLVSRTITGDDEVAREAWERFKVAATLAYGEEIPEMIRARERGDRIP